MQIEKLVRAKLANLVSQVTSMGASLDGWDRQQFALKQILHVLNQFGARLDAAIEENDEEGILSVCENINQKIYHIVPILGFLLRSTNVRNAFELDYIVTVLARRLTGNRKCRVIISSEWDYIPFALPLNLRDLPNFVFIGLPISEAQNALIIPIIGHEIAHAVWNSRNIEGGVSNTLQIIIDNIFDENIADYKKYNPAFKGKDDLASKAELLRAKETVVTIATDYAQEVFCDIIAYSIFQSAYIKAFAYMLAPNDGSVATLKHPPYKFRISVLEKIAIKNNREKPTDVLMMSGQVQTKYDMQGAFLLRLAQGAVMQIMPNIERAAQDILKNAGIPDVQASNVKLIVENLRSNLPVFQAVQIGDLLSAAWIHFDDQTKNGAKVEDAIENISELIFKSVEIVEYEGKVR